MVAVVAVRGGQLQLGQRHLHALPSQGVWAWTLAPRHRTEAPSAERRRPGDTDSGTQGKGVVSGQISSSCPVKNLLSRACRHEDRRRPHWGCHLPLQRQGGLHRDRARWFEEGLVKHTTGEGLALVDQDEMWGPTVLQMMVKRVHICWTTLVICILKRLLLAHLIGCLTIGIYNI